MKKIIGILFLVLLLACEKEEGIELLPVDSALRIEMTESVKESSSEFTLIITTEKDYPCQGYILIREKEVKDNRFTISFTGVKPPEGGCLTALGPAMAFISLGNLTNGVYGVTIHHGNFSSAGRIEVTDEEVFLDFDGQEGIIIPNSRLQR
ncbi:hypothetical protein [Nafulsella turpanensis]|uniref:hypothetical protein n=1 Tax=Nafulsella turpanensis TaxID=1265690 RepID=UPI0003496E39|nr:hypothetical protein [Nafulsella turpanensis]